MRAHRYNPQLHGPRPSVRLDRSRGNGAHRKRPGPRRSGRRAIVLEKVPEEVAGIITRKLRIPTIGIGSGLACDGQVLVINDLLGVMEKSFRHARKFLDFHALALQAVRAYTSEVERGAFPEEENLHHLGRRKWKNCNYCSGKLFNTASPVNFSLALRTPS